GNARTDLAGVGIHRVAPAEDEVERAGALQRRRQGLRGRERVTAGEAGVGDEDAAIRAPRYGFAQRVLRRRRPEREHRAGAARLARQLDPFADRTTAVRVHLEIEPGAAQHSSGAELHLLDPWHLLDQDGYAQAQDNAPMFKRSFD